MIFCLVVVRSHIAKQFIQFAVPLNWNACQRAIRLLLLHMQRSAVVIGRFEFTGRAWWQSIRNGCGLLRHSCERAVFIVVALVNGVTAIFELGVEICGEFSMSGVPVMLTHTGSLFWSERSIVLREWRTHVQVDHDHVRLLHLLGFLFLLLHLCWSRNNRFASFLARDGLQAIVFGSFFVSVCLRLRRLQV